MRILRINKNFRRRELYYFNLAFDIQKWIHISKFALISAVLSRCK